MFAYNAYFVSCRCYENNYSLLWLNFVEKLSVIVLNLSVTRNLEISIFSKLKFNHIL